MKKILSITTLTLFFIAANGQNKKYVKTMEKNLAAMDTCKTQASYQKLANAFERISGAEKKEWLPLYYAADCYILIGYMESDKQKMDDYFTKAQGFTDRADSLSPKNSEIYTMRSWVLSAMIGVNPMMRGAKLGPESGMWLEKAIELDKTNPRPYFMKGQSAMYTPAMWGGGKDKAIVLFEKALELFKTFKPASSIAPNWGEQQTKDSLAECKKK